MPFLTLALALAAQPGLADAAGLTWLGRTSNDWSNAANWSLKRPPVAGDTAVIDALPQVWLGSKPGAAGALYLATAHAANLYLATGLTVASATLGRDAGSNGTLVVSGISGKAAVSGSLAAGVNGSGTVDLYNASRLQAGSLTLGQGKTGVGALIATGRSALAVSGTLVAGGAGRGSLGLYTDATAATGAAMLGVSAGAIGGASLSGAGTRWTNAATLTLGAAGRGTMDLATGARLSTRDLKLATGATGTAAIRLSNAGTRIDASGALSLGGAGKAGLSLYTGAALSAGSITAAELAGSTATLIADGGGTRLVSAGLLTAGAKGNASVTLSAGATASASGLVLGRDAGAVGAATLSGTGSVLTAANGVDIGAAGTGTLLLTGGATLDSSAIRIASAAGSSGTLSIGSAAGTLARGAGAFTARSIHFGDGDGHLVFNFGGPAYAVGAVLSGNGTIDVQGGDVSFSAASSAFTGLTRIAGGSLSVDGELGGNIALSGYGTLAGSGTVGTVSVGQGARIAPAGSATGTLTIHGDLSFAAGSHYQASVAPLTGKADRLAVSGATRIDPGAVLDVVQASAIDVARQDTILESAGGITGNFDNVTSNYAFVTPSVTGDGTHLVLNLTRNDVSFASAAATPAALAAAKSLAGLGTDNPLVQQVLPLSASAAAATLQDLAGTLHASPALVGFDVLRFGSSTATDRLGSLGESAGLYTGADETAPLAYAGTAEPGGSPAFATLLAPEESGASVWGRAYAGWSRRDSADGPRDGSAGGLFVGIDGAAGEATRLGVLGGFGRSTFTDGTGAEGTSNDWSIGLYGSHEAGPLSLRFGGQYTLQGVSTRREARFNGFTETLEGHYNAHAAGIFAEAATRIETPAGLIEPFLTGAVTREITDAFAETGGHAALDVSGSDLWLPVTTLGLRAGRQMSLGGREIGLHGMVGWQHAYGARGDAPVLAFQGGQGFATSGTGPAANSLLVEAGIDIATGNGARLGLAYDGQFEAGASSHMVKLSLSQRF